MPRYPMPDVVVLLPGIMGSVLQKDGKTAWGLSMGTLFRSLVTGGGHLERSLALPHDDASQDDLGDGVRATALMPDLHLLPGIWKIDGYARLADAIQGTFDVVEGQNFFRFPYDWRRDNRVAARRLARQTHHWLAAWRQASGRADAKLLLVAHSMGGLVSRYFLEVLEGWKDTRALITFGTPYRGALNALDGLSNGIHKGPLNLTDLGRQFTALYQLLPIFPCYDPGDGTLVRVGETTGIPHVDPARAAAALTFHREIEAAVETNRQQPGYGYALRPVVGIAQPTFLSARRNGAGVTMLETLGGKNWRGDGTVPRPSATPLELGDNPAAMFAATKHGSLQNADAVLTHLTGVLSGFELDLGDFRGSDVPLALTIGDLFFHDEPLDVYAAPLTPTDGLALTATLYRTDDAQPLSTAPLTPDGDGYRTTFAPPGEGSYRVTVSGPDAETVEDAFAVMGAM